LPFGFPEKKSLETVFFITLRNIKTYGVVAGWFFGHKGASLSSMSHRQWKVSGDGSVSHTAFGRLTSPTGAVGVKCRQISR
jgi:hypothetical protein